MRSASRLLAALLALASAGAFAKDSPLTLRLLERGKHEEATLTGNDVSCDGDVTGSFLSVDADGGRVRILGGAVPKFCRLLRITGDIRVVAGEERRGLRGTLLVSANGDQLRFNAELKPEDYVGSVIHAEADALPSAALEAQAIVTRSYALANRGRHLDAGYDFCDLTHCQLYRGDSKVSARTLEAAKRTEGQVLTVSGKTVSAYFHAACGGATASSKEVFGDLGPRGVSDLRGDGTALCAAASGFDWTAAVDATGLFPGKGETRVLRRGADGRVEEVIIHGRKLSGPRLLAEVNRRYGHSTLLSTRFDLREHNGKLLFKGRGVGHGVGFCQAGAAALARDGKSATGILKHYFPDATLTKR